MGCSCPRSFHAPVPDDVSPNAITHLVPGRPAGLHSDPGPPRLIKRGRRERPQRETEPRACLPRIALRARPRRMWSPASSDQPSRLCAASERPLGVLPVRPAPVFSAGPAVSFRSLHAARRSRDVMRTVSVAFERPAQTARPAALLRCLTQRRAARRAKRLQAGEKSPPLLLVTKPWNEMPGCAH